MIARNLADCRSARYEYVRNFEQPDILLANTWIVVRIDGRGFSKYVRFLTLKFFSKVTSHHYFFLSSCPHTHMMRHLGPQCLLSCQAAYCILPEIDKPRISCIHELLDKSWANMLVFRFTTKYKFVKPNDRRALDLMNAAAEAVMKELTDLVLAYGNSDEFRYVLAAYSPCLRGMKDWQPCRFG
jgi:hypothetical protein